MATIHHSLYDLNVTLINKEHDFGNLVTKLRAGYNCFALDCESVGLGRHNPISLMNLALEDGSIYLIDLLEVRLSNRFRSLLKNPNKKKVMFDCRADADCLKHMYGVQLQGIEDLQIMEYVIQHPDLQPAHTLPSLIKVINKYEGKMKGDDLVSLKPNKPYKLAKWADRPLKQFLLDYASLEIAFFLPLREKLIDEMPWPYYDNIQQWSERYASSRVANHLYSIKDPYQSHHFMELGILTKAESGIIECKGCRLHLKKSFRKKIS